MKITPQDIAERLWHRKRFWYGADPVVAVSGKPGSFGKIVYEFAEPNGSKFPVGWNVFVQRKEDLQQFKEAAEEAIRNFDRYINQRLRD